MATAVLQLGGAVDWSKDNQVSPEIVWQFNGYPPKKPKSYAVVILAGVPQLSDKNWDKLVWDATPYATFYKPGVDKQLSAAGQRFLRLTDAQPINQDIPSLIKDIENKYYFGQTGIRVLPNRLVINALAFPKFTFGDAGHLYSEVDSDDWVNFGYYKLQTYVDPYRRLRVWLDSERDDGVALRFVFYDSNHHRHILPIVHHDVETIVPTKISAKGQFLSAGIQVRGHGKFMVGTYHYSWARYGAGLFLVGGQRIIDPHNGDQLAYYFGPGDLKPPLNIYFSGARAAGGFEAYPLMHNLHAPFLLFADPRMEIGQFYTGAYIEKQILKVIKTTLKQLGFTTDDLIMAGMSMGTYGALKYGSELGAHAIVISKVLANLGYMAKRSRLQRPDEFGTIFDIDRQLTDKPFPAGLDDIDKRFWDHFKRLDLSRTRLLTAYMFQDDYDNHAIPMLKKMPPVQDALQFAHRGYPGHHNDNTYDTVNWMIYRIREVMHDDFGRFKEAD